jgi:hypothetical protein
MKKLLFATLIITLAVSYSPFTQAAAYGGGTGTALSPYQIWTPQQMNTIGANPADWNKHFVLMDNIDMSIYTSMQYNIIGNSTTKFTGSFEGNGKKISNFTIIASDCDYIGLFGYLSTGGQIKNVGVENINVIGRNYVGGIVGYNSYGIIKYSYATGSVCGTRYIGGLVGENPYSGVIESSYAACSVNATTYNAGGLVGYNSGGTIIACYAIGSVSAPIGIGGLVGANSSANIAVSFWDMDTSDQTGSSGGKGLTTKQMKTISIFQNAGWAEKGWVMVDGIDYPRLSWENTNGIQIPLPQAVPLTGSGTEDSPYLISTPQEFALLSWYSNVLDKHIRQKANLDLNGIKLYPIGDLGQFTGVFDGDSHSISHAVINQPDSNNIGLFSYLGSGGEIKNLKINNVSITGKTYVGGLLGNNYYGTITSCFADGSVSGLDEIGVIVGRQYRGSIISCYATGYANSSYCAGGLVGDNHEGTIKSCHTKASVDGGNEVGGIAGMNTRGSVSSCSASGSVIGEYNIGGLIGANSGAITACCATGNVSGISFSAVGGLVGLNYMGSITSCYATRQVSSSSHSVGGLVGGDLGGEITSSYAIGSVCGSSLVGGIVGKSSAIITACFWNISTSGTEDGIGNQEPDPSSVIGHMTPEMMTLSTFTDAGWDFSETDGDPADWMMLREGDDYPRLAWQTIYPGDIAGLYGVNIADLTEVIDNWLRQDCPTECEQADIDNSGTVDLADLSILASDWMK